MKSIAVIGCGCWSRTMHGPAMQHVAKMFEGKVAYTAVCDLDEKRGSTYATDFGFKCNYTSIQSMMETESPDAVVVLVSPVAVYEVLQQVIPYGVTIMTEKPPVQNIDELQDLLGLQNKYANEIGVAFNRRFNPFIHEAKEYLAKYENPDSIYCEFIRNGRFDNDFSTTAVHGLDTVHYLADSNYATLNIERQPAMRSAQDSYNIFCNGWCENGIRTGLEFLVDGGVLRERYHINGPGYEIDVVVSYIHGESCFRAWEDGRLVEDRTPEDLQLDVTSGPVMQGVYQEHLSFAKSLLEQSTVVSPLSDSFAAVKAMNELRDICNAPIDLSGETSIQ